VDGFINLRKPAGPTSHDMVAYVRRLLRGCRVGHGGTLDPLAEGVLPIGVGQATRLLSFWQESDKAYRARVVLGQGTTTYDAEGEVTTQHPVPALTRADLEQALAPFRGEISQVPPPFSAIRRGGQRFYQRARAGELVSPPARQVHITRLELLSWDPPALTLEIVCGSGTYVRSLAHDVGERLGCGAHLGSLVRTRVGSFRLEEAVTPEVLSTAVQEDRAAALLQPLDLPVRHWPAVHVDAAGALALAHGQALAVNDDVVPSRVRVYGPDGHLLALARGDEEKRVLRPFRVFGIR
jgi:tRNA pseudouridine55 synthase